MALSGGADSTALCLLVQEWMQQHQQQNPSQKQPRVFALAVDHGLRPESAVEALQATDWLRLRGLEAVVLPVLQWEGGVPGKNRLQLKARDARYDALKRACVERRVKYLLVGHHAGDQVPRHFVEFHQCCKISEF